VWKTANTVSGGFNLHSGLGMSDYIITRAINSTVLLLGGAEE